MYRCKIYSNGTLVRDFIPCYRNSDNVIGLYDTLNNVFYTNVGTGTFTKSSNSILPNLDFPISIKSSGDEGKINVTSSDGTNTTNYTVTLPTGTVGGKLLNGVQDTIDSTGLFTKKVGKIILNGTESWIFADSTTTTARFQCATTRNLIKLYPNNDSNCLLSDKFKTDITVNGYTEVIATHNYYGIQMMILKSRLTGWSDSLTSTQKVTLLQTYLASNNVTVYYELATPVTTQLTLPKLNIFDNITYITTQNAVQADLTVDLFTWLGQIFKYTDFNDFLDRLNVIVQSKIGSALTYQGNAINTLYKANGNFLFCEDVETLESTIAYMCDRCGQEFNKTDWGNLSTLSHKDLDKFEQGLSRIMQGQYVEKILYPADDLYPSNKLFMK